jgi:hypothetical protein
MKFHKIWVQQCRATRRMKKQFGVKSALDYLLGKKLLNFAEAADQRSEFAAELPRFQAEVWNVFNPYELAGYLTTLLYGARVQPGARTIQENPRTGSELFPGPSGNWNGLRATR